MPTSAKTITIETNKGTIVFETFAADAPKTVQNFTTLAQKGFYDGVNHRSLDSFNMGQEELVSKFTNELKKMIQEKN